MHPQRLLHSFIGDTSSDIVDSSSSHPINIEDNAMSVNNISRYSHNLALDEIPGFDVREAPTTPRTRSEISGSSIDELRRAYTTRLSEME